MQKDSKMVNKEQDDEKRLREAAHDKTLADSFPTSDPPSTIPNPADETTTGAEEPREKPDAEE